MRGASLIALAVVCLALTASILVPSARAQGPRVLLAEVSGPIDRTTVDYMDEALSEAAEGGYAALVVRFDTPGGDLESTAAIYQAMIRATNVPVLGWVGPVGANAASAGTILLEWTDVAAMAPGTTIGSVQPVVLGPTGFEPVTDPKIINYVVANLEEGMRLHARNVSLAREFVVNNLNLNAEDALRLGATDYVAGSVQDLLAQANGRHLLVRSNTSTYKDIQLDFSNAEVLTFTASARVTALRLVSDPLVASLFLILGIYLLIFGLQAPGHGAEIAGIILLLLALIGLGFSVDPIALLLIILGIILLILEAKNPGFGAFGIGGIVAIAIGAIFLAPLRPPRFVVTPEYQIVFLVSLLTPTLAFGGFLLFALYKVMEVRRRKPTVGEPVGEMAVVTEPIAKGQKGYVRYKGELWQALAAEDLAPEVKVYIHRAEGLLLHVSREPPPPPSKRSLPGRVLRVFRRKAA